MLIPFDLDECCWRAICLRQLIFLSNLHALYCRNFADWNWPRASRVDIRINCAKYPRRTLTTLHLPMCRRRHWLTDRKTSRFSSSSTSVNRLRTARRVVGETSRDLEQVARDRRRPSAVYRLMAATRDASCSFYRFRRRRPRPKSACRQLSGREIWWKLLFDCCVTRHMVL